ncbi:MAG: hypothetical protein J6T46_03860 [Victivallales bacterium]|nr:hypothetical protein [Victivallales bacterium]
MKKILQSILLILFFASFAVFAQDNQTSEGEKAKPTKTKAEFQKYAVVEFSDLSMLSPAQKKHLELYRQQYELQKAGKYSPKKCFGPIYTPMAEFAKQLRPLALNAATKAQQSYEKLVNEKKDQMAKRMQVQFNAYGNLAKYCEKIEKAFKEHKSGDIEEGITLLQRQLIMMKNEGLKVPNREWLTQKEAETIMAKVAKQKKAMHGVPQGGVRQQPNVRPQTNGNK